MAVIGNPFPNATLPKNMSTLRVLGLFLMGFSAILGPLILFATPIGCTFVGGIQVILFGLLFILGSIIFAVSFFKKNRAKSL